MEEEQDHFIERRKSSEQYGFEMYRGIVQQVSEIHTELKNRRMDGKEDIELAVANIVTRSFPEGDPEGHKRYHEAVIKQQEAKADLYRFLLKEGLKYGLITCLCWIGYSIWQGFILGIRK
jgi:hypothetical protein